MSTMTYVEETSKTPFKVTKLGDSDGAGTMWYKEPVVYIAEYDTYIYTHYEARKIDTADGVRYGIYQCQTVSIPEGSKHKSSEERFVDQSDNNKALFTKEEAILVLRAWENVYNKKAETEISRDALHTRHHHKDAPPSKKDNLPGPPGLGS
ncbi:MAG: hypothetical protein K8R48_02040 [Alphaproteobacteria bacterium]|nr:hypothetical protein [Alphaproteobacteria bacterium]